MFKIKANKETVLKKEPKQSTLLADNKLHHVDVNKVYVCEKIIDKELNHIQVELAYSMGKWWIWPPDWDGIEEPITTGTANPPIIISDYTPAVQRQIDRLSQYGNKNPNLNTKTTYWSQRDNSKMPHRTCNTTSNAMLVRWYQQAVGITPIKSDEDYLPHVFKYGDTIYHGVQTKAIKDFGFNTKWMTDGDLPFVKDLLEAGFPVVCNILHRGSLSRPTGGHIIMLIAYDREKREFIAHDPYGTLSSNYRNHNGAFSRISEKVFVVRWQRGYRILA
ncbi:MAG: C39 family peptidase [Nitrososphaeraceae archaeon]|nr:C39 family peptidase [Nitrososphaeraceae archaeon]